MRVAILTSDNLRHHYYVNSIGASHEIVALVREKKRNLIDESKKDKIPILEEHLKERDLKEKHYFGTHLEVLGRNRSDVIDIAAGEVNAPWVFDQIKQRDPEVLLLFGTSIVKDPILSHYEGKIINMHLGLSPYYRGSATNFWPLVNNQPECVGVTIHHAVLKVDAGPVLHQVRPGLDPGDSAHDIGCKSIIAGVEGVCRVLDAFGHQRVSGSIQKPDGRLYKRKDFSAEAVERMQANFGAGMISCYLEQHKARDEKFPIIEL